MRRLINLDVIDGDVPAIRRVQTAEQVQQRAFSAAGGAAEGNRLAGEGLEINALEHCNRTVVVALPYILGAEDDARLIVELFLHRIHSNRSASTARTRMA